MDKNLEYIGTIRKLEEELSILKQQYNEIRYKYEELKKRYTRQNDELYRLKIELKKKGEENDNN